ncbi:MAG: sigma 54-dependent Fis family transcriptional regulator [Myxococcaceae bacterium]|nr:sigma 54-dependent Fis family transcriptional regulator [Myxococcaceae bacterium]
MSQHSRTQASRSTPALPRIEAGVVRVLDGGDRGAQRELKPKAPVVVGSDAGCDLVLRDPKVSRRHCELTLGRYGFVARDLESRNGTHFEGSRVGEVALPAGAILKVGDTHLALETRDQAVTLEPSAREAFGGLVGRSVAMRRAFTLLERAAASDAIVLLTGETGAGKELAARGVHAASARANGPFEVFDCGAVSPGLLHDALFGHARGAFTGASAEKPGAFVRAAGGTLFLDEVAEVPLPLQGVLLRALEEREVLPLGAAAPVAVDVRIVAATRRDLAEEVVAGRFREDLYYRLNVLTVTLPPLRARKGDLTLLVPALLRELGLQEPGVVDGPNLARLESHRFAGNVRELRNVLERALVRGARTFSELELTLDSAPTAASAAPVDETASFSEQRQAALDEFERAYVVKLLAEHQGNIKAASRASGVERTQLKRLMRKHGLR